MNKIFFYELRRCILNKFYFIFLGISLVYSYTVLSTQTIMGIANTAPFSAWSFGHYIARSMLPLVIALLFIIRGYFTENAKKVQVITDAAPINQQKYFAIKCTSAVVAWLVMVVISLALGWVYLALIFKDAVEIGALLLPTLICVVPLLLFAVGGAVFLGKINEKLILIFMGALFVMSVVDLPHFADLFGSVYFSQYPALQDTLDPAFTLTMPVIVGKIAFAVVGVLLAFVGVYTWHENIDRD